MFRAASLFLLSITCCLLSGVTGQPTNNSCPNPPNLDPGELDDSSLAVTTFTVGTNVTYKCRPGYIRIYGKLTTITCLNTHQWSVIPNFCQRRDCRSPGELTYGEVVLGKIEGTDVPDTFFGAEAKFSCYEGYRLVGRNSRTCLATGFWSNVVPTCEAVICVPPPDVLNGEHTDLDKETFYAGNGVTYTCKKDFTLLGNATISCTGDGTWSGPAPTCEVINCPDPSVLNGKKTVGFGSGPYKYGESVTFQCNEGFTMQGKARVVCSESNVWQPPVPTCEHSKPVNPGNLATNTTSIPNVTSILEEKEASTVGTTKANIGESEVPEAKNTAETSKDKGEGGNGSNAGVIAGNVTLILAMLLVKWSMLHGCS